MVKIVLDVSCKVGVYVCVCDVCYGRKVDVNMCVMFAMVGR